MADGTLVAISNNVRVVGFVGGIAKRSITVDFVMCDSVTVCHERLVDITKRFIDWYKSMAWVDKSSVDDAGSAVVPIRAVETLVSDTVDVLITTITYSMVSSVAARFKKLICKRIQRSIFNSGCKGVFRVMAVLKSDVAGNTEVVVIAYSASNKVCLGEFLDARIASTGGIIISDVLLLLLFFPLFGFNQSSLGVVITSLWCESLSSTAGNSAILDGTLNHPVSFIQACHTLSSAIHAEVKVTVITYTTVVVDIRD
jgi:hypothetical protein